MVPKSKRWKKAIVAIHHLSLSLAWKSISSVFPQTGSIKERGKLTAKLQQNPPLSLAILLYNNGVYNIDSELNNGNLNGNSCAVGLGSPNVDLIQAVIQLREGLFNGLDQLGFITNKGWHANLEQWTIRPIGGVGSNFYTIRNATGL